METDAQILELARSGCTTTEIAERTGLPARTVRQARARLGCPGRAGRPRGQNERVCVRPGDPVLRWLKDRAKQNGYSLTTAATYALRESKDLRDLVTAVARVCRGHVVSDADWEATKAVLGPMHPGDGARLR